jgi:hypothetical protein
VSSVTPSERIEKTIFLIRGHKVLLDEDLAKLYGVTVGRLNEAVKRNTERFPEDFMFQLTFHELRDLRSQIAISKKGRGGRRYAFTEHGAIMAANVLNTQRAIEDPCRAEKRGHSGFNSWWAAVGTHAQNRNVHFFLPRSLLFTFHGVRSKKLRDPGLRHLVFHNCKDHLH